MWHWINWSLNMSADRADSFLRLIRRSQRGRLKIYLGYAAGVGKTYQMLLEAHRLKGDGIDVVVGLVETHGRAETEALLAGLETVPLRTTTYRGIEVGEMDVDAIQARRPSVVLIDELAHTNLPGSRNAKRYQDVEDILAAGIHVVSALNIQHLESLYEVVEHATKVKVRERLPDHVVAEADQLVNVDITSEDLRRRLADGKVYTQERVETALNAFFKASNLEQLRELALRELAAQLDSRRRDSPLADDASSSLDQIMVCLSSRGPNSEALLRYASRLAGRLNRNWYAVYVQTDREAPTVIDAGTQRALARTLTLAQQLGATVFTYKGDDVVKTVLQFAHEYRVGHIVLGSPGRALPLWRRLKGEAGIVERLAAEGRGVTVVVHDTRSLSGEPATAPREAPVPKGEQAPPEAGRSVPPSPSELSAGNVVVWAEPVGKEEAMRQLLEACHMGSEESKRLAWAALLERERQGETFVGADVAIPHARLAGLAHPLLAVGLARAGIRGCQPGRAITWLFLLLTPDEPPECHVKALGAVCAWARDDRWRKRAEAAGSREELAGSCAGLRL
jgi:two-component system sensor histidine kinase KdpD